MIKKIDHINIVIENLDEAKAFFLKIGFKVQREGMLEGEWLDNLTNLEKVRAEYVGLSLDGAQTNLELLKFYHPKSKKKEGLDSITDIGFRHMALEVEDIEKVVSKLKKEGVEFFSIIQSYKESNKKLCYLRGPEGIVLELAEYEK